ncbi:MAG: Ig-like domain-containing protein [Methanomicrobia archaeon]|nr:Ig-like domain-containing protein [Methanomicrobia archaeon]
MTLRRNKLLFLGLLGVIILAVTGIVPQAVWALPPPQPQNATYVGTGNGSAVYFHYYPGPIDAKIFKVNLSGTIYDAYCIDIYTAISINDTLTVNGSLAEGNQSVNWTAINYILYTYNYSSPEVTDKDNESAAIQAAIWYFTSEPYGLFNASNTSQKYQFMTDPKTDWYDGRLENGSALVRDRAFEVINDTKANASTFKFPTRIELNASEEYVLQNQTVNLTATVYDQDDARIQGVTVKFAITEGNGTLDPDNGTTNDSGQFQVNFTGTDANATTVVAWVEGSYGTLLRGDILYPSSPVQNVSTITLIPRSIEELIVLPVPEQSTLVLTSTGVLALVGYVTYSRRKKKEE